MGRSAGTGSPVTFICPVARRNRALWSGVDAGRLPDGHDRVVLTGRTKPSPRQRAVGLRSDSISREYRCECGHVGWSNHVDLRRYPVAENPA